MDKCLFCGREITTQLNWNWLLSFNTLDLPVICNQCKPNFELLGEENICPGCGRAQTGKTLCQDCLRWQEMGNHSLLNNRALYAYDQFMKAYIQHYKFMGDYYWRLVFQAEFSQYIKTHFKHRWLFTTIPIDLQTESSRGFNQVDGLLSDIKTIKLLQYREKENRVKQSTKTRRERMETIQPFVYCGTSELNGLKVVLLDDIYTTGRTLYHAKDILEQHGARLVRSVTLAR